MTNSQIDKLGERLKTGNYSDDDLRLLDEYRRSFDDSYEIITKAVPNLLGLVPTGRPAKSTLSIIAKLQRQPEMQLSRMQDIAGCRIVVDGISDQEEAIEKLCSCFKAASLKDRRKESSHGYRPVHLILKINGQFFEIQIRTVLQQLWAELSERLSDKFDARIKYGQGPEAPLRQLTKMSELVREIEDFEEQYFNVKISRGIKPDDLPLPPNKRAKRNQLRTLLESMVSKYDLPN